MLLPGILTYPRADEERLLSANKRKLQIQIVPLAVGFVAGRWDLKLQEVRSWQLYIGGWVSAITLLMPSQKSRLWMLVGSLGSG